MRTSIALLIGFTAGIAFVQAAPLFVKASQNSQMINFVDDMASAMKNDTDWTVWDHPPVTGPSRAILVVGVGSRIIVSRDPQFGYTVSLFPVTSYGGSVPEIRNGKCFNSSAEHELPCDLLREARWRTVYDRALGLAKRKANLI